MDSFYLGLFSIVSVTVILLVYAWQQYQANKRYKALEQEDFKDLSKGFGGMSAYKIGQRYDWSKSQQHLLRNLDKS